MGPKAFNSLKTDSLAQLRQQSQYEDLLEIIKGDSIFSNTFLIKDDGDSISYSRGYERAGEFWHLRNQTMAKHILQFVKAYKGQRIVVLNGFFHRYYLNSLLRPQQDKGNFIVKEFYDY